MMEYKGYVGKVEFDDEADVFYGQVINLRDVITFEGESVPELRQAFQDSVEDYLAFCTARGEEPEKPYSGKLSIRMEPDLHRKISIRAQLADKSVNSWITDTLQAIVTD